MVHSSIVTETIRAWYKREEWIAVLLTFMFFYSVVLLIIAYILGLGLGGNIVSPPDTCIKLPDTYRGYLEKLNWLLYPLFWTLIAVPVHFTWHPFFHAWEDIKISGVLHISNEKKISEKSFSDFEQRLQRFRKYLFTVALIMSLLVNFWDMRDLLLKWYCIKTDQGQLVMTIAKNPKMLYSAAEYDFTIASIIQENNNVYGNAYSSSVTRRTNFIFNLLAYLQQIVIAAIGFFVLFQVLFHCFIFWFLEKLKCVNLDNFEIIMDPKSPLHEFGLERWNYALNNIYWVFSLGMFIPIISRASQHSGKISLDVGQIILQVCVPLLIALPMILTILGRQQRLLKLWELLRTDKELATMYHNQRLWPLDKNWVSKFGIILTFFLLSYFLGVNLLSVLN